MIKRTYLLTILLIVCLLTGCGNKTEKMCRIEIRNENSTDVITLEQQSPHVYHCPNSFPYLPQ